MEVTSIEKIHPSAQQHFKMICMSTSSSETARSLILFRLTSSVIRKSMYKIVFLGHPMEAWAIYVLYLKCLTQRNLVAEFHPENISFTHKQRIIVSEQSFFGGA